MGNHPSPQTLEARAKARDAILAKLAKQPSISCDTGIAGLYAMIMGSESGVSQKSFQKAINTLTFGGRRRCRLVRVRDDRQRPTGRVTLSLRS